VGLTGAKVHKRTACAKLENIMKVQQQMKEDEQNDDALVEEETDTDDDDDEIYGGLDYEGFALRRGFIDHGRRYDRGDLFSDDQLSKLVQLVVEYSHYDLRLNDLPYR
jgi:hypothetical protein